MPVITLLTTQITVLELAQFRFRPKKLFFILGIEFILQVGASGTLLFFFGYEQYAKWFLFTMIIPSFLTFFYISKRRDFRDIFTILTTMFLNFTISIPSMWISQILGDGYLWYNIFRIIFFVVLLLFLHTWVRKRYIQVQHELEKGWGIFCILPAIGTFTLYLNYLQFSTNGVFYEVFLDCIVIVFIMTTVFVVFQYVFDQLHEKYLIQEQKRVLSMQNKAQRDQFVQHREMAEITNRRWHDLRHNTQELIELLEAGNTDVAISYLKEQRGMDEVPKEEYCLHPAVNSILCLWAARSRKAGIAVEILTDIPRTLDIEPLELSALFANAFENAYDACLRLPDTVQRSIKVEAHYNGKRLAIGFTNSCHEEILFENDIPVSVNKGGGIGTRSIVYTVRRFRGSFYFSCKDNIFSARFVLNI
jgi:hypothetical protein